MARVYAGELTRIDVEVVGRLQRELPDEFSVFAEVNIERNIDVIVIRPMGQEPALLVAAELKCVWHPLMGQTDGLWREMKSDGQWHPIRPSNNQDINHHWQSVNAADALKRWLWVNQRRYLESRSHLQGWQIRVWPQLVLYGLPQDAHELPDQPVTRFGSWFFNIDDWIDELKGRCPREGMALGQLNVDRLVRALGLMSLPDEAAINALSSGSHEDPVAEAVENLNRRVLALELMLSASAGSRNGQANGTQLTTV